MLLTAKCFAAIATAENRQSRRLCVQLIFCDYYFSFGKKVGIPSENGKLKVKTKKATEREQIGHRYAFVVAKWSRSPKRT